MMDCDVLLIHPPAIYDFRGKAIFYGPIASTVSESTNQFMTPPVGMLSIADYLDRNGYKVLVDNIDERMITSESFDAEKHIANLSARVYAIGLHWCIHSQGAIEIARLCKKLHPEAFVVLGGLTATIFHEEIVRKFEFVVERILLFQNTLMGGKEYWSRLLATLQNEKINLTQLTMELFGSANEFLDSP